MFFIGVGVHGYCEVLNGYKVNELNLTVANGSIPEEPENLVLPEDYVRPNDSMTYYRRRKRSVDHVVPSETQEKGGLKRKIVVMVRKSGIIVERIICKRTFFKARVHKEMVKLLSLKF